MFRVAGHCSTSGLPGSAVTVSIPPVAWIVCPGSVVLLVSHHFLSVCLGRIACTEMSAHGLFAWSQVPYLCKDVTNQGPE